jgi:hypothetical protein
MFLVCATAPGGGVFADAAFGPVCPSFSIFYPSFSLWHAGKEQDDGNCKGLFWNTSVAAAARVCGEVSVG